MPRHSECPDAHTHAFTRTYARVIRARSIKVENFADADGGRGAGGVQVTPEAAADWITREYPKPPEPKERKAKKKKSAAKKTAPAKRPPPAGAAAGAAATKKPRAVLARGGASPPPAAAAAAAAAATAPA